MGALFLQCFPLFYGQKGDFLVLELTLNISVTIILTAKSVLTIVCHFKNVVYMRLVNEKYFIFNCAQLDCV